MLTQQGISYCTADVSVPVILALNEPRQMHASINQLRKRKIFAEEVLSFAAIVSLQTAYWLSPSRARHPYLHIASILVGLRLIAPYVTPLSTWQSRPTERDAKDYMQGRQQDQNSRPRLTPETSDDEWEMDASGMRATPAGTDSRGSSTDDMSAASEHQSVQPEATVDDKEKQRQDVQSRKEAQLHFGRKSVNDYRSYVRLDTVFKASAWLVTIVGLWGDGF